MDRVIKVENIGKKYIISHQKQEKNSSLSSAVIKKVKNTSRRLVNLLKTKQIIASAYEEFWALKDISFEVSQGERIGIIGKNGAGKTTLLKILSRITEPTEGEIAIKGRVASLLEVGTGFHPELTGRENIFLNGAILGMGRSEMKNKFDEIVDFAGVEKFIDTPVKRYSSGMYVRLAFAVAAHLEPEILLIDEVLSVGDAEFQRKCIGKMGDATEEGRTVLFVSHNMEAIRRLCPRTILIAAGHILLDDRSDSTISTYLSSGQDQDRGTRYYEDISTAPGDEDVRLRLVRLVGQKGTPSAVFDIDESIQVELDFFVLQKIRDFHILARVYTETSTIAFSSADWDGRDDKKINSQLYLSGLYRACFKIPGNLLNYGSYTLNVIGYIPGVKYVFSEESILRWEIKNLKTARGMMGISGINSCSRPGIFRPVFKWDILRIEKN